jgi:hypothetical protein
MNNRNISIVYYFLIFALLTLKLLKIASQQFKYKLMNNYIDRVILETPDYEDLKTIELFKNTITIRVKGFLSKEELINILKWTSPRPLRFYKQNKENDVIYITRLALAQSDDALKIHILSALKGVNYPSASAILMFDNPEKFPVLDIRVWKQLYKGKLVNDNARGMNFTLDQWRNYLYIIRSLSTHYGLSSRQIEKRIFDYDKLHQKGTLYNY